MHAYEGTLRGILPGMKSPANNRSTLLEGYITHEASGRVSLSLIQRCSAGTTIMGKPVSMQIHEWRRKIYKGPVIMFFITFHFVILVIIFATHEADFADLPVRHFWLTIRPDRPPSDVDSINPV